MAFFHLDIKQPFREVAASGNTHTIDLNQKGNNYSISANNATNTLTFSNLDSNKVGKGGTILIHNPATTTSLSWAGLQSSVYTPGGSAVVFDNTPPTLASLTVSSSNSTNGDYGIEEDIISLAIISAEDLQGDATKSPYGITSATIAGRSVDGNGNEIISKVNAINWSAQVQLNGSEASAPVSYSFTMTDLTGNQTVINENVSPIKNALEKVNSISGNTFEWNEKTHNKGKEVGVIAQEVEKLQLPGVTTTRQDGTKAVRYEKLIPLLIEAIKELKGEIDELKRTK